MAVKDNRSGNAIKTWTGTRAQYNAITTKDANTLYNITDDSDITYSMLELLYPVGSIYIGTMATCPLATLGVGTWTLKTSRFLVEKQEPTAENNYTWYNLYSDGWCEQGGVESVNSATNNIQITFLKPFIDDNYTITIGVTSDSAWGGSTATTTNNNLATIGGYTNRKTSTSFYFGRIDTGLVSNWYACGYTSTVSQLNQWERVS